MVVARGEGVEVVETVDGDGVLGGIVADSGGVAGDLALGDVVGSLGTEKEAITTKDGVCSERGTLNTGLADDRESETGYVTLKTSRAPRAWTPDCL